MQYVLVDFVWVCPKTADVYLSQIAFLQGVEVDMGSIVVSVTVSETTEMVFTVSETTEMVFTVVSTEIRERQSVKSFLLTL